MKQYDVIIVGAGPAGLRCAEILGQSEKKVLLLEKKPETGPKVCAGSITRKSLEIMEIPHNLFEFEINKAKIVVPKSEFTTRYEKGPFAFMINRKTFGQWQQKKLKGTQVEIMTSALVTNIEKGHIEINRKTKFGYQYLVGADGAYSKVRRFLRLPVKKRLITFQYLIPAKESRRFEIYMDSRYFQSGYGWVFPHKGHLSVGCLADPHHFSPQILKANFHRWLKEKGFDISHAGYQSFPIAYDYRGYRFGNIFLAGEAAGLASGLTGEGIYAALISGEEIARMILDPCHPDEKMQSVLHYKRVQDNFLQLLNAAGPLRQSIFNTILYLMNNKRFNRKVTNGFS
ncbi:MAG: geranylgeranyl diphosphate reductase [bacterium]|nr:MAG: geranylgeranyl diphosphate reductase [bacterium]